MTKNDAMRDIRERYGMVELEYKPDTDSDTMGNAYLEALQLLTPEERKMMIAYSETASMTLTARLYGRPNREIQNEINRIRTKLKDIYERIALHSGNQHIHR